MRASILRFGTDQLSAIQDSLVLEPQACPPASALRDGDVIVTVRAAEVVWTDTIMITGQYQHQPRLPYTPGMTYAGIVHSSTPKAAAAGFVAGSRVAIAGWDAGPRSHGAYQSFGGCASYAVAPMSAIRRVPASWSFEEAACFAYGYDTAYHCLVEVGKVKPGESILIQGATGGVGIPAVKIAVMLGLKVIAVTRDAEKSAFLRQLGVTDIIVLEPRQQPKRQAALTAQALPPTPQTAPSSPQQRGGGSSFAQRVKALTGGKGVDIVYDGVGGNAITVESMRALRFGGRLLIVGWAATPNVAQANRSKGAATNANVIPTNLIMMKSLQVLGCPAMIAAKMDPAVADRRVADLERWFNERKLSPPEVGKIFPLSEIRDAFRSRVNSGGSIGSCIVVPPLPTAERVTSATSKL